MEHRHQPCRAESPVKPLPRQGRRLHVFVG
jgi:hypothetical protein